MVVKHSADLVSEAYVLTPPFALVGALICPYSYVFYIKAGSFKVRGWGTQLPNTDSSTDTDREMLWIVVI